MSDQALDAALLAAHAADDKPALVRLYRQAGERRLSEGKTDAGCFYLTQAYIFALDCGDPAWMSLRNLLASYGREA